MKKNRDKSIAPIISDVDRQVGFNTFPYTSLLSFAPLIQFWKTKVNSSDRGEKVLALEIVKQLDSALDLLTPIRDSELLNNHKKFIHLLMSGLFPLAQRDQQMAQAVRPFSLDGFYRTNRLKKFLKKNRLNIVNNKDVLTIRNDAIVRAGCMILNTFYGQNFPLKDPYIFTARADDTLVETHYKAALNLDFLEIKKRLALPSLSEEEIFTLINNFDQPEMWLEKIPPTHFEFHGLVTVQLVDVTEEESMSRIRQYLLQKDAVLEANTLAQMEDLLASYFNIPGLRLGLTDFHYPLDVRMNNPKVTVRQHLLKEVFSNLQGLGFAGSVYEEVCQLGRPEIFQNLDKMMDRSPLERALVGEGIRSIYLAPLQRSNGDVFALLELGAPEPYALNSFIRLKIKHIQPLFRTALSRKIDEINNAIGAILRKKYTNIHPAVEWRFLEEANRILAAGKKVEPHPIIFEKVYPLYGQSDIVASTMNRNRAVQIDLMDTLESLLAVLTIAKKYYQDRKTEHLFLLVEEMHSSQENLVIPDEDLEGLQLIRTEVYPYLEKIKYHDPRIEKAYEAYKAKLNPTLGLIAIRRENFEQSVKMINKSIVELLNQEEIRMQKVLPHYFERYQTDGIEYDVFLGNSLLQKKEFERQHLETFRLWQLKFMCELTRRIAKLTSELPHQLTTAQLILVHSQPLSIRFRMDEKKFDVDGAANIRYAVLKKRIDKALILGTANRLTLSGHVAIVYTQDKDRQAYLKYLGYLVEKQLIAAEIEELELAALQGIAGLRALRVRVLVGL